MKKQNKKIIITLIGIVSVIILALLLSKFLIFKPLSINFADPTSFYQDSELTKYQYNGQIPLNPESKVDGVCVPFDISSYGIDWGITKPVPTGKSEFKFLLSNVAYQIGPGGSETSSIRYDIDVYWNNQLIDTIEGSPTQQVGTCSPELRRTQVFYRAYSDDGEVYKPLNEENTPIIYRRDMNLQCPPNTFDTSSPYFAEVQEIKLPKGKTGINAEFGFEMGSIRFCSESKSYVVNKFEIVNSDDSDPPVPPINLVPLIASIVGIIIFVSLLTFLYIKSRRRR